MASTSRTSEQPETLNNMPDITKGGDVRYPEWIQDYSNHCVRIIGTKCSGKLEELMELYLRNIKQELDLCMKSPNRAALIARLMYRTLIFFYMYYQDIKEYFVMTQWSDLMVELLSYYCQMEMKASHRWQRGKETDNMISGRIMNLMWTCLSQNEEYMFHVLLKIRNYSKKYKDMFDPIFKKLLTSNSVGHIKSDFDYIRKILMFKTWKKVCSKEDKKSISDLALTKLCPSEDFLYRISKYNFLPRCNDVKDIHKYLITTLFDLDKSIEKYFSYVESKHLKESDLPLLDKISFLPELYDSLPIDDDDDFDTDSLCGSLLDQIKHEAESIGEEEKDVIIIIDPPSPEPVTHGRKPKKRNENPLSDVIDLTEDEPEKITVTDEDQPSWLVEILKSSEQLIISETTNNNVDKKDDDLIMSVEDADTNKDVSVEISAAVECEQPVPDSSENTRDTDEILNNPNSNEDLMDSADESHLLQSPEDVMACQSECTDSVLEVDSVNVLEVDSVNVVEVDSINVHVNHEAEPEEENSFEHFNGDCENMVVNSSSAEDEPCVSSIDTGIGSMEENGISSPYENCRLSPDSIAQSPQLVDSPDEHYALSYEVENNEVMKEEVNMIEEKIVQLTEIRSISQDEEPFDSQENSVTVSINGVMSPVGEHYEQADSTSDVTTINDAADSITVTEFIVDDVEQQVEIKDTDVCSAVVSEQLNSATSDNRTNLTNGIVSNIDFEQFVSEQTVSKHTIENILANSELSKGDENIDCSVHTCDTVEEKLCENTELEASNDTLSTNVEPANYVLSRDNDADNTQGSDEVSPVMEPFLDQDFASFISDVGNHQQMEKLGRQSPANLAKDLVVNRKRKNGDSVIRTYVHSNKLKNTKVPSNTSSAEESESAPRVQFFSHSTPNGTKTVKFMPCDYFLSILELNSREIRLLQPEVHIVRKELDKAGVVKSVQKNEPAPIEEESFGPIIHESSYLFASNSVKSNTILERYDYNKSEDQAKAIVDKRRHPSNYDRSSARQIKRRGAKETTSSRVVKKRKRGKEKTARKKKTSTKSLPDPTPAVRPTRVYPWRYNSTCQEVL